MHPLPFALAGCLLIRFDVGPVDPLQRILALIAILAGTAGCTLLGDGDNERRSRAWIAGYVLSWVLLWRVSQVLEFRYAGRTGYVCSWAHYNLYADFLWAGVLSGEWGYGSPGPFVGALASFAVACSGMAVSFAVASFGAGGRWTSLDLALRRALRLMPLMLLTLLSFDIVVGETAHEFLSGRQLVLVGMIFSCRRIFALARLISDPPPRRAAPGPDAPAVPAC